MDLTEEEKAEAAKFEKDYREASERGEFPRIKELLKKCSSKRVEEEASRLCLDYAKDVVKNIEVDPFEDQLRK